MSNAVVAQAPDSEGARHDDSVLDYAPEPVPAAIAWWAECYPQWRGR